MENQPLHIPHPINLQENSDTCTSLCEHPLEYSKRYALPSEGETTLAVIPIKKYNSAEDFFANAFGKNTRYQYRKVAEEGYTCRLMTKEERNSRLEELYAINTSAKERQGGEMNEKYFEYPKPWEQETCPHHFIKTYGAFAPGGTWVGYIDMVTAGAWTNAEHILGHQQYLDACKRGSFMVNLWFEMVKDMMENEPQVNYIQYHLMHVGNPGLDEWKRRVGLEEMIIK